MSDEIKFCPYCGKKVIHGFMHWICDKCHKYFNVDLYKEKGE